MNISIIAAVSRNNVIGHKNALPWHLPEDMKYFQKITMGKPVIMGGKTFESIGKALPKRTNIILSKDEKYKASGCVIAHSIEEALKIASKENKEIMIIGGESTYKQFLPLANKMYLTFIDADFKGDTYFPEYNKKEWKEIERTDHLADEKNLYPYSFVVLVRSVNI